MRRQRRSCRQSTGHQLCRGADPALPTRRNYHPGFEWGNRARQSQGDRLCGDARLLCCGRPQRHGHEPGRATPLASPKALRASLPYQPAIPSILGNPVPGADRPNGAPGCEHWSDLPCVPGSPALDRRQCLSPWGHVQPVAGRMVGAVCLDGGAGHSFEQ